MVTTLSARIFLLSAAITLAGLGGLAWVMTSIHTANLEGEAVQGALRLSDTICRSTRYSMLQNRKQDVYEMVSTVGAQPGIERIRLYNKEGEITFSTDPREKGQRVDTRAEACTLCHSNGETPLSRPAGSDLTRIFAHENGDRVLGLIAPIYNDPGCSTTGCHAPPEEQSILGVLDVQSSFASIDAAIDSQNQRYLLLTYAIMLCVATACGAFIWYFVHRPVRQLIRGTQRLARGDLEHRIEIESGTEIGRLAQAMNRMAADLARARRELTEWAKTLEQRVEEKTKTLRQAQTRLLQNEKMASLGLLSAVVAHEINNPLSGVLTYAKLVRKKLRPDLQQKEIDELAQYLEAMETETARCGKIVNNLLAFSRQSAIQVGDADINGIVSKTLFLIGHKLELQSITLHKDLSPDMPSILCDKDRIQQTVLAILINAVEAMPEGGALRVSTRKAPDTDRPGVQVLVEDTGVGIAEDELPRLFEPFYTTKQHKNGVGLGLSVVYGIVKRHQGRIEVRSEPGQGTTFIVTLPERAQVVDEIVDGDDEPLVNLSKADLNVRN